MSAAEYSVKDAGYSAPPAAYSANSHSHSVTDEDTRSVPPSADHADIRQLRLLFAVDSRFPGLGGAESQALKLAIALRERGAFVEFVTPRVLQSQSLTEEFHGFTVNRVDYPHIRWIGSLVLMIYFARYLLENRRRFDAVHVHITHLLAASAGFCRRWSELPVTTKISGYYEFEGGVLDQRKRFRPLNYLLRAGLRQVDYVQTISEQTRQKLLDAGFRNEQIRFIPNGIDTSVDPQGASKPAGMTVGYCGRLRQVKGVHVLLGAFARAQLARPQADLHLAIAGSGETEEALRQQAESLGIAQHIQWLGLIEDTQAFFRSLDIYVQPSFAEGLPNSVMEAMVEQQPVIASDIGGNTDLVVHEHSGLLFAVGDEDQLAEQIVRMIDDPDLRRNVAAQGRELMVQRFGFNRVVDQLVGLYRV